MSAGSSEFVPILFVAGGLTTLLGHDSTFWIVVISATILKIITSESSLTTGWPLVKEKFISFLAGIIPPFVATKGIAAWLEITDKEIILLVGVLLVIMGEGLVRWLTGLSNNPNKIFDLIKTWRGGN